jgi:hypothetical protein
LTFENYIKARLVSFVIAEGYRYGGTDTMLAIAQVIKNRVEAGWGDWLTVIETAPQYAGTVHAPQPPIEPRDLTFRKLLAEIDNVYYGTADDSAVNVEGEDGKAVSLYYCEMHNLNRDWFRQNVTANLQEHPRIAQVSQLTFFG